MSRMDRAAPQLVGAPTEQSQGGDGDWKKNLSGKLQEAGPCYARLLGSSERCLWHYEPSCAIFRSALPRPCCVSHACWGTLATPDSIETAFAVVLGWSSLRSQQLATSLHFRGASPRVWAANLCQYNGASPNAAAHKGTHTAVDQRKPLYALVPDALRQGPRDDSLARVTNIADHVSAAQLGCGLFCLFIRSGSVTEPALALHRYETPAQGTAVAVGAKLRGDNPSRRNPRWCPPETCFLCLLEILATRQRRPRFCSASRTWT
jgi:hypothetical protein